MAIIGEKWGLFPLLRKWVQEGRPIWGTCAGMILLSNNAVKMCDGGQSLVGGMDVKVFGTYVHSINILLYTISAHFCFNFSSSRDFPGHLFQLIWTDLFPHLPSFE